MAERSWPFDSTAGDRLHDAEYPSRALHTLFSDGVVPNADSDLVVTQNSPAAANVLVGLGHGWVQGHHYQLFSAVKTITVAANASGNPRIDRIVLRRSLANREVTAVIKNGTPAGVPSAPSLTQNVSGDWEVSLAQIAVANGFTTIVTANITDERTYVSATQTSPVPVGTVFPYAAASAPSGYLLADGTAVSRTTYATLFALIGTTYGNPNGSQFNLPDLRGRVAVGLGIHSDVGALGNVEGDAVANRTIRHRHTVNDTGHAHSVSDPNHSHSVYAGTGGGASLGGSAQFSVSATDGSTDNLLIGSAVVAGPTNISINGATTGITVGVAGAGSLDRSAFLTLQYIIKV